MTSFAWVWDGKGGILVGPSTHMNRRNLVQQGTQQWDVSLLELMVIVMASENTMSTLRVVSSLLVGINRDC